jgi:hypothetical protein
MFRAFGYICEAHFFNPSVLIIGGRGPVLRTATIGDVMQTLQRFLTTELKVASRCRYAQYRGLPTTLRVKGMLVTGLIRSLREDKSSNPVRWVITVVVAKRTAAA